MKTIISIIGGWGVYLMVLSVFMAIASLLGIGPSLLWSSLLAAFLAGLFAGNMHRKRAVLVGALAACPLIIILTLTALITGKAGLLNLADVENSSLVFVFLSPVLGAIGGWIGAQWLPQLLFSKGQAYSFAQTSIGVFIGFALIILLINVPDVPLYLFMAGMALLSFSYAGYQWAYKPSNEQTNKYGVVLFSIFGCLSVLLAAYLWVSPLPAIPWSQSVSLLLGGLLGFVILWFGYKRKNLH